MGNILDLYWNEISNTWSDILHATTRIIYDVEIVRKRCERLTNVRSNELPPQVDLYQKMIERWWERFQIKPSRILDIESILQLLPNFRAPLEHIQRNASLCVWSTDWLEIPPMLLVGPPWVGKTHFARKVAELLWVCMNLASFWSLTAWWILSGSSSQWKWGKPGKVFEALVDGKYANPVIVLDEVDKAATNTQYDPVWALYSLLEHDTARDFTDEFAEVPIDTSQVIWILTANDISRISRPILDRLHVFEIQSPTPDQARQIGRNIYQKLLKDHEWWSQFESEPSDDVLDILAEIWPRDMRKALMSAFGWAKFRDQHASSIVPWDFTIKKTQKQSMGFIG